MRAPVSLALCGTEVSEKGDLMARNNRKKSGLQRSLKTYHVCNGHVTEVVAARSASEARRKAKAPRTAQVRVTSLSAPPKAGSADTSLDTRDDHCYVDHHPNVWR